MGGVLRMLALLLLSIGTSVHADCNEIISYGPGFHGIVRNQFGPCSGQGECLNGSSGEFFCQCKDGWTGRSDWINTEGEDCQINVAAVKIMWGVDLAFILLAYVRGGPLVFSRWRSLSRRQAAKKPRGSGAKSIKLAVRSMYGLLGFYCVCMPLLFAFGLLRIIDDNERVGVTIPMTTLFILVKAVFYICAFLYQPAQLAIFIKSSLKGVSHDLARVILISNIGGAVFALVSIGLSFIVIGPMVYPEESSTFYAAYIGGLGLSFLWYGLQAAAIKWRANILLTVIGSKGDILASADIAEAVKKRVNRIENEVIGQTVVQLILFMATLSIVFLYNKHDYFLPITWFALISLPYKAARTHISGHGSSDVKRASRNVTGRPSKPKSSSKSESLTPSKRLNQSEVLVLRSSLIEESIL